MLSGTLLSEQNDACHHSDKGCKKQTDPQCYVAVVSRLGCAGIARLVRRSDWRCVFLVRKVRFCCRISSDGAGIAGLGDLVSAVIAFDDSIARSFGDAADGDGFTVLQLYGSAACDRSGFAAGIAVAPAGTDRYRERKQFVLFARSTGHSLADGKASGLGFCRRIIRVFRRCHLCIFLVRERSRSHRIGSDGAGISGLGHFVAFVVAFCDHIACIGRDAADGDGFTVLQLYRPAACDGSGLASCILKASFGTKGHSEGKRFLRITVSTGNGLADGKTACLWFCRRIIRVFRRRAVLRVGKGCRCSLTVSDLSGIAGLGHFVPVVIALCNDITCTGRQSFRCHALSALQREGGNTFFKGHIAKLAADSCIGKCHGEGESLCSVSRVAADRLTHGQTTGLGRYRLIHCLIDDRSRAVDAGHCSVVIQGGGAVVCIDPFPAGKRPAIMARIFRRSRASGRAVRYRDQLALQFCIVPFVAIPEDDAHAPAGGQVCPYRILGKGQCVAAYDAGHSLIVRIDRRVVCRKCRGHDA